MPKSLRVLVTGATGLAGSHTVRALLDAGHQVRALVRSPEKAHRVFAGQAGPLESVQGDIGDVASVRSALGEMGVHLRDIDETMQDTVDWLREAGHLQG